jgi:hypothetical protein
MTELIELRLQQICDSVDHGIVTVADATYLIEFIKAQSRKIEEMKTWWDEDTAPELTSLQGNRP